MRTPLRLLLGVLLCTCAVRPASAQEAWRTAAHERIEQHRKGTFHLTVRGDDGQPLPNTEVRVRMTRHAFGFGTAISYSGFTNSREPNYRDKILNLTGDGRTFNMAVYGNEMKWPQWEGASNQTRSLIASQVALLRARGFDVRGHNLVWAAYRWMPGDIQQNSSNPDYVKERIQERIDDGAGYRALRGTLRDWDVLNEPVHLTDIRDIFKGTPGYPTGEEIYAEMFRWAAEADPNAHLYINEYNIIAHYRSQLSVRNRYKQIIQNIIDAGAPLHGIGFQGHFSPSDPTSMEDVYRALEEFAVYGRKLSITEYDYAYSSNSGTSCTKANEAAAATYMRNFLTVAFSHPAVESFLIWGFWDGDHWRCDAALFRDDWTLKPSGQAYLDLVFGDWWTDETVTTDANGVVEVRGFLGDYTLSTTLPDGAFSRNVRLDTTGTASFVLARDLTDVEGEGGLPGTLVLEAATPNPVALRTTLRYALPAPSSVRLAVYDALGREVARLVDADQPAGWHEVPFDTDGHPAGLYFYRLTAGATTRTGALHVTR